MESIRTDIKYQVNPDFILQYFGDELMLYNQENQYQRIVCNSVESDIIQAINKFHTISDAWQMVMQLYNIPIDLQAAKDSYFAYMTQLIDKKIIMEGDLQRNIWGIPNKYYPLFVSIELTNLCNFQCTHCYKEAKVSHANFIPVSMIKDIINTIGGTIYSLDLTGGEAVLHPQFAEIVSSINVPILNLLTNGSNLTNVSDNILQRFNLVQVSLYGKSDADYKKYTNTTNFNAVCSGLEKLLRLNIPTTVVVILRQENIICIDEYLKILSKIGVQDVQFGISLKSGRNSKDLSDWDISFEQCQEFEKQVRVISDSYPNMRIKNFDSKSEFNRPTFVDDNYSLVCDGGKNEICISETGRVRPCVMLPEQYFGYKTWDDYKVVLEGGSLVNYDNCIKMCVADLKKKGETIDTLCPYGFNCK